jgi:hypothetical protein
VPVGADMTGRVLREVIEPRFPRGASGASSREPHDRLLDVAERAQPFLDGGIRLRGHGGCPGGLPGLFVTNPALRSAVRLPHRQGHALGERLERDPHTHAERHLVGTAMDHVADQTRPFVGLDEDHDVRQ